MIKGVKNLNLKEEEIGQSFKKDLIDILAQQEKLI